MVRIPAWVWYAGAAALLGVAIVVAYSGSGRGRPSIGPASLLGSVAPSFDVQRTDGAAGSLAAFRGHIVVLNLWATWCPPCRAEMPDLQRLYATYRAKNVVVLGVDQGESPERARAFARSLGVRFPLLVDSAQQYGRVYAALGIPTTFVIDPKGVVVRGFDGELTYAQMVDAIAPLLPAKSR